MQTGLEVAERIGYPVVLRPAYTLGGSGGGIAENREQCAEILENGLRLSRVGQVLVERCIAGWKEIEYEVMRDGAGNVITVCNMENIDPVGVHTGDSIVVAPSQTLGDKEYQMLRTSALNIITELGITGGCNVQYALHPESFEYCVIEVNPRVSRSSALASKATGYPIAKVAAKIALGYTLDEIKNAVTKKTYASFEPMLDYCVVKMPRLPFDKFISAKRTLGTQMKATGEVMSICTNFEGALMKAIRSLEQHVDSLMSYDFTGLTDEELTEMLHRVDDRRIWVIAEALRRGVSYETHPRHHQDRHLVHRQAGHPGGDGGGLKGGRKGPGRRPSAGGQEDRVPGQRDRCPHRHFPGGDQGDAPCKRHPRRLQDGGHLRGGVCRGDALLLLLLRQRERGGPDRRQKESAGSGLRTHPHRPGYRVRLLLRAQHLGF